MKDGLGPTAETHRDFRNSRFKQTLLGRFGGEEVESETGCVGFLNKKALGVPHLVDLLLFNFRDATLRGQPR